MSKQQRQHAQENNFIRRLADYCAKNNLKFEDTHEGTGPYDCIINDIYYYDIKATDHSKLSYRRTLPNGYEYEPHLTYMRIPYLICLPNGKCYKISKQEFRDYVNSLRDEGRLEEETTIYNGDGNENLCVNISLFLNQDHLIYELNDCVDPWSTFINFTNYRR